MKSPYIGTKIHRVDAREKVTGEAKYSADYSFPDMVYLKVLRAPHPHCSIKNIDVEEARKVPGVLKVITARDIPEVENFGMIIKDQEVLVREKARYMGDALAIVAAETESIARKAIRCITVDYEPLPVLTTAEEAMDPEAIAIHPCRDNTCNHDFHAANVLCVHHLNKGDVDKGFAEADHIFTQEIATPHVEHVALQPESGVAVYDEEKDLITMWVATQWLHDTQADVAQALNLGLEQVQIIQPAIGGAFGKREDVSVHIHIALMARLLKRPVKMVMTREESMITQNKRHPITFRFKTGVKKDGTLTAWEAQVIGDTGAYASTGSAVVHQALYMCTGPYNVANVRGVSYTVYTNNTYCGAMRGFGATQAAFAYETHMDMMAHELGWDPVEFRLHNAYELGSVTPNGQVLTTSVAVRETMRKAREHMGPKGESSRFKKRGVGIATSMFGCGYGEGFPDHSIVELEVTPSGIVRLCSAAADVGQGVLTVMIQIVAQVLDIPPSLIELAQACTHNTLNAGSTSATRQTIFSGNAARIAAEALLAKIYHRASQELAKHHPELQVRDGQVQLLGDDRSISLGELACLAQDRGEPLKAQGCYFPRTTAPHEETGQGDLVYVAYTFNTHMVEVEVDTRTGIVDLIRVVAVPDIGRVINLLGVEGQSEGGIVMGQGMALMEEQVFDEGRTVNADLASYLIPTAMDMPEMLTIPVESGDACGPFGSKGIGEPALLPAAPAILNAIYDAVGIRLTRTPAHPHRLLEHLKGRD